MLLLPQAEVDTVVCLPEPKHRVLPGGHGAGQALAHRQEVCAALLAAHEEVDPIVHRHNIRPVYMLNVYMMHISERYSHTFMTNEGA